MLRRLGKAPDYVVFTLEGDYPEYPQPKGDFIQRRLSPTRTSLLELTAQFRTVAADARVRGVVLQLRQLSMPSAKLETIRDLIGELRAAGKHVVTWSTNLDTARYYLACAADKILLMPSGYVHPFGMSRRYLYLADALDKVGLHGDFVSITPYKSASDMFSRSAMSDEVREMSNWLIDSVFDEFISAIAQGRHIDGETARALVDQTPVTDLKAIDLGVVDKLVHEDDLPTHLQQGDKPAQLMMWEQAAGKLVRRPLRRPGRYVALLTVEGLIVDGKSARPPIMPPLPLPLIFDPRAGDESVVQAARKVLADKRAAAVVLYIDSGGGSATSSEAMAATLKKIAAKKPLVVVMGPVAASGGYYVATPAQHIFAQPGTVTGSIGVIMGKLVNAELLDRLLLNRETISRGKNIGIYESESTFGEEEQKLIRDNIERTYDVFLDRVTASRKMERETLEAIAGGRVWTGRQALENGLVDELGGLDRALAKTRELGGLHASASVRLFTPDKQAIPPVAQPAAAFEYALAGMRSVNQGGPLCLCPIVWVD